MRDTKHQYELYGMSKSQLKQHIGHDFGIFL